MNEITLVGVYASGRAAADAAAAIRRAGLGEVETVSPTADHAVLAALPRPASPVRLFTLLGALAGCAAGIALPVYTMVDWPLVVGGKPLVSIPPVVVIAFELSMLGAALGGLAGFLALSGLPSLGGGTFVGRRRPPDCTRRFTVDRFGVLVTCAGARREEVRAHLEQAGAEEVAGDA